MGWTAPSVGGPSAACGTLMPGAGPSTPSKADIKRSPPRTVTVADHAALGQVGAAHRLPPDQERHACRSATTTEVVAGARQAACPYQTEYHLAYLYLKRAAF